MNLRGEMVFLSEPYAVSGKAGQIWVLVANVLGGPEIIHYGVNKLDGELPQTEITKQTFALSTWLLSGLVGIRRIPH